VTVIVRGIPLVTAACGTRVARPASTRRASGAGDGSRQPQARPALMTDLSLASRNGRRCREGPTRAALAVGAGDEAAFVAACGSPTHCRARPASRVCNICPEGLQQLWSSGSGCFAHR
jgi:hypothetical protein